MTNITTKQYWDEINSLAESIIDEAMEQSDNDKDEAEELINDSLLHETIDGHQWVIYYTYNLDVIKHSDNEHYMMDNFGPEHAGELMEQGIDHLHMVMAFWCIYADVQEKISNILEEMEG